MAQGNKKTERRMVPVEETTYELVLSKDEALLLARLLAHSNTNGNDPRCKLVYPILNALKKMDIDYRETDGVFLAQTTIYFSASDRARSAF